MENRKYYGCENPEAVSYLEFGSINLKKGEKKIWNYWQDQAAYDLYMFARYSRDLFAFRKFIDEQDKSVEKLNEYILNAAHNKIMDYIFKYAGIITAPKEGIVCESGSSLFGWIDEAIACDYVYENGKNIPSIKNMEYLGSDISEMMNQGAAAFHSDIKMCFSTAGTICDLVTEITETFHKKISLFYGVSVSLRYALREAEDLVKVAECTDLSIFNRLSVTYGRETLSLVYGSGKSVYVISLPRLLDCLKRKGFTAKYCTANMQHGKDGEKTVRISIAISKRQDLIDRFIEKYTECIDKSIKIQGVERGEWKEAEELLSSKNGVIWQ